MTDVHIRNRDLRLAHVPNPEQVSEQEIWDFAYTFDGAMVWGGRDSSGAAGFSAFDAYSPPADSELPSGSLLGLRSALYAACDWRRSIDLESDMGTDPGTVPGEFLDRWIDPRRPSSEAQFQTQLRRILSAIKAAVGQGPAFHEAVAIALAVAAAALEPTEKIVERDLQRCFITAFAEASGLAVAPSETSSEVRIEDMPNWAERPGAMDLVAGPDLQAPLLAAEMKWNSEFSHSVWDAVKLIGLLAKGSRAAYLIAGHPRRAWGGTSPFIALYRDGPLELSKLPLEQEWPSLLAHSAGRPRAIPHRLEITEVSRVTLWHGGEPWELRTVAIEPGHGGWLYLDADGQLPAQPAGS